MACALSVHSERTFSRLTPFTSYILITLPSQIPTDVDVRVMLTFLELYQTLLGFVFFKLYADAGLVYPPPLDMQKDEGAAGIGAFNLKEMSRVADASTSRKTKQVEVDGKLISGKDVRQTIKNISVTESGDGDVEMPDADTSADPETVEEDFVPQLSTSNPQDATALPTLQSLSSLPQSNSSKLFAPFTFWLSRETSRPIFEFLVRSFGGRIGWPASSGGGSAFDETDESITHVIIDRPLAEKSDETEEERERRRRRKYVQPQWVVDCINAGKILFEEPYTQGKTLPPHLSPFEAREGAYDPTVGAVGEDAMEEDEEEVEDASEVEGSEDEAKARPDKAALAAAAVAEDAAALRAAELEAEAAGVDFGTFEKQAKKSRKKAQASEDQGPADGEEDMNKMMMSNKQRKLYEKMKYSQNKRTTEVSLLFLDLTESILTQAF